MSTTPKTTGSKFDTGKPPISLVPREAIEAIARALQFGAKKYSADNFKGGIAYRRLLDASMRHITAYAAGETLDPESHLSHIDHALASLSMLTYMIKFRPDLDDRYQEDIKYYDEIIQKLTISEKNDKLKEDSSTTAGKDNW